jgi:hypothetical protein
MRWGWLWFLVVASAGVLIDCGGNAVTSSGAGGITSDASGGTAGAASSGAAGQSGAGGTVGANGGSAGSAGTANDWRACELNRDCVVRPRSCCGNCGAATPGDSIAINRGNGSGYTLAVCQSSGCPACYAPPDPMLQAGCTNGKCEVFDLRTRALTMCMIDSDCRLRTSSCCECGGNVALEALIAIRAEAGWEYEQLVCDPNTPCDDCAPPYPELARARCFDGRCTVTGAPGTTPPPP